MEIVNHEYYVSFEVAKLLKEFGFDFECRCYYETSGKLRGKNSGNFYNYNSPLLWQNNGDTDTQLYSAPTIEVAQRWLREIENIDVYIFPTTNTKRECVYQVGIKTFGRELWIPGQPSTSKYYTYEEALETGIKKALELILKKKIICQQEKDC